MTAIKGKVVWLTGAGTGIGEAAALMLAKEGARLALLGRRLDPLQAVAEQITGMGGCRIPRTKRGWLGDTLSRQVAKAPP